MANLWSVSKILVVMALMASGALMAKQPVPTGFDGYAVFMAAGTIPLEPHPDPEITGCGASIFCDGAYFHEQIMGRDAAEIEAEAARAKDYFLTRFGIDVDALVADGRLRFFDFFLDPRGEYRAYTVAGHRVLADGWVVRDGGFAAEVLDPAGIPLGGTLDGLGLVMPPGGLLVFGSYNILRANPAGHPLGEIVIDYRSDMPMIANAWGELAINCQISVDGFAGGQLGGKAQGMGTVVPSATFDSLTLNWRNVLTLGGLDLLP